MNIVAAYRTRLIPARAGNTPLLNGHFVTLTAHPRSRGEHSPGLQPVKATQGSSPLARGTQANVIMGWRGERLIPARAGNTRNLPPRAGSTAAHPRSRGEHVRRCPGFGRGRGSSPLARGTQDSDAWIRGAIRLIPARAGNTWKTQKCNRCTAAHPRSRGEHRSRHR